MEKKLIAAMLISREAFDKLNTLDISSYLSDLGSMVYEEISHFYVVDIDVNKVDLDSLRARIKNKYPKYSELLYELLSFDEDCISIINILEDFISLKREALGNKIAASLLSPDKSNVASYMEEYLSVSESVLDTTAITKEFDAEKLDVLFQEISDSNKIRFWPRQLNDELGGGVHKGSNVLVFGRSNVGKTMFTINLVCGMLHDKHKVLVVGNEDPLREVVPRYIARMASTPTEEIEKDVRGFLERYRGSLELFRFLHMEPGSFRELHRAVEDFSPDVLVIDQIRNIRVGNKAENKVIQMELVAQMARNLGIAKDIIVVGITQAGDSARNKLVLDDGDIDFSNTGMPGAMDLIIGVGSNESYEEGNRRMITIVKNKINGNHTFFPVSVNKTINKVTSV